MCVLPKLANAPVLKYQLLPQPLFAYPKLSASVLNYHLVRYILTIHFLTYSITFFRAKNLHITFRITC